MRGRCYKNFFSVIYATISATSVKIGNTLKVAYTTPKKSFIALLLFRPLTLNRRNISVELYLMLLVTCAVKPLIAVSQNRKYIQHIQYIQQNETENQ